jgi:hypothetical protein
LNVEGIREEMSERGLHREGVVEKSRRLLRVEVRGNEERR